MKKRVLAAVAAVGLVVAGSALAARLYMTSDPAVLAELESGAYANCQTGVPSTISGDVTWVCARNETGSYLCCQID
jgi:hypothetical protein